MGFDGRFTKAPTEIESYDVDFSEWLEDRGDVADSYEVTADDGVALASSARIDGVVRVKIAGGKNGNLYKVAVELSTVGGLKRRSEFGVRVRGTGVREGDPIGGGTPWESQNPNEPFSGGGTPLEP